MHISGQVPEVATTSCNDRHRQHQEASVHRAVLAKHCSASSHGIADSDDCAACLTSVAELWTRHISLFRSPLDLLRLVTAVLQRTVVCLGQSTASHVSNAVGDVALQESWFFARSAAKILHSLLSRFGVTLSVDTETTGPLERDDHRCCGTKNFCQPVNDPTSTELVFTFLFTCVALLGKQLQRSYAAYESAQGDACLAAAAAALAVNTRHYRVVVTETFLLCTRCSGNDNQGPCPSLWIAPEAVHSKLMQVLQLHCSLVTTAAAAVKRLPADVLPPVLESASRVAELVVTAVSHLSWEYSACVTPSPGAPHSPQAVVLVSARALLECLVHRLVLADGCHTSEDSALVRAVLSTENAPKTAQTHVAATHMDDPTNNKSAPPLRCSEVTTWLLSTLRAEQKLRRNDRQGFRLPPPLGNVSCADWETALRTSTGLDIDQRRFAVECDQLSWRRLLMSTVRLHRSIVEHLQSEPEDLGARAVTLEQTRLCTLHWQVALVHVMLTLLPASCTTVSVSERHNASEPDIYSTAAAVISLLLDDDAQKQTLPKPISHKEILAIWQLVTSENRFADDGLEQRPTHPSVQRKVPNASLFLTEQPMNQVLFAGTLDTDDGATKKAFSHCFDTFFDEVALSLRKSNEAPPCMRKNTPLVASFQQLSISAVPPEPARYVALHLAALCRSQARLTVLFRDCRPQLTALIIPLVWFFGVPFSDEASHVPTTSSVERRSTSILSCSRSHPLLPASLSFLSLIAVAALEVDGEIELCREMMLVPWIFASLSATVAAHCGSFWAASTSILMGCCSAMPVTQKSLACGTEARGRVDDATGAEELLVSAGGRGAAPVRQAQELFQLRATLSKAPFDDLLQQQPALAAALFHPLDPDPCGEVSRSLTTCTELILTAELTSHVPPRAAGPAPYFAMRNEHIGRSYHTRRQRMVPWVRASLAAADADPVTASAAAPVEAHLDYDHRASHVAEITVVDADSCAALRLRCRRVMRCGDGDSSFSATLILLGGEQRALHRALHRMEDIHVRNKAMLSAASAPAYREACTIRETKLHFKRSWWEAREALNAEIRDVLFDIQSSVLTPAMQCVLLPARKSFDDSTLSDAAIRELHAALLVATASTMALSATRKAVRSALLHLVADWCVHRARKTVDLVLFADEVRCLLREINTVVVLRSHEYRADIRNELAAARVPASVPSDPLWFQYDELLSAVDVVAEFVKTRSLGVSSAAQHRPSNERDPLYLCLGNELHCIPWEGLHVLCNVAVLRIPSLLPDAFQPWEGVMGEPRRTQRAELFYVLNPTGDLTETEKRMRPRLEALGALRGWRGVCGRDACSRFDRNRMEPAQWLLYLGHAGGEQCVPRGVLNDALPLLSSDTVPQVVCLMGCSSAASFTSPLHYDAVSAPSSWLHAGAHVVVGTLLHVSDGEIDRVTDALLRLCFPAWREATPESERTTARTPHDKQLHSAADVAAALTAARRECRMPLLTGSVTVCYARAPVDFFGFGSSEGR